MAWEESVLPEVRNEEDILITITSHVTGHVTEPIGYRHTLLDWAGQPQT